MLSNCRILHCFVWAPSSMKIKVFFVLLWGFFWGQTASIFFQSAGRLLFWLVTVVTQVKSVVKELVWYQSQLVFRWSLSYLEAALRCVATYNQPRWRACIRWPFMADLGYLLPFLPSHLKSVERLPHHWTPKPSYKPCPELGFFSPFL